MDFWRGEAYSAFFDFLDATGGFLLRGKHRGSRAMHVTTNDERSVGETLRCTASASACSHGKTRSTSSTTLDMNIRLSCTVRKTAATEMLLSVHARRGAPLVRVLDDAAMQRSNHSSLASRFQITVNIRACLVGIEYMICNWCIIL